jgi:uncharacterized protein
MKNFIIKRLKEIEDKENIKILYAVESGSRAWGFASKDSDFDVRFIYIHRLDWYLSIKEKRDVIELPISNALDVTGWDVKKALKLFSNSNPPLYEWLHSPTIYLEQDNFAQKLRDLMPVFYSPNACLHHYLHMAEGNYREYLKDELVRIKKYFYVLRPILACMWIETQKIVPPMEFEKLLHAQKLDKELVTEIESLLLRKRAGEELNVEKKIEIINNFLEDRLKHFEQATKGMKAEKHTNIQTLDNLFKDLVSK